MDEVIITNGAILTFANVVTLIVPLFIIAILVDSSKGASRIGPINGKRQLDKSSARQSRRTLLAIAVGVLVEGNSLIVVLTSPNNDFAMNSGGYAYLIINSAGLLVLFYILFIPHIELHISNIRNDPDTTRWTLVVGWLAVAALIVSGVVNRFIQTAKADYILAYVLFGLSLMLTGAMITLTVSTIRRGRHLSAHSAAEEQDDKENYTSS